ncbi:hypothetical protein HMPREF9716_02062, partial [Myroides odoratus CIP 103059]
MTNQKLLLNLYSLMLLINKQF